MRALEDGIRETPRDRWDPEYVVAQIGRDPAALFRWVQQNTNWIPYRGLLRGATGVLMDREGNSLDRSVLLGTLLTRAGQTVRLAHGDLGHSQAAELLPSLVAAQLTPAISERAPEAVPSSDVQTIAAKYHLDGPAVERTLGAQQAALERLVDTLNRRVTDQTSRLLAALKRPDSATDWRQRYDSALAALQDHWWVQRQEGAGWVDLDLLAPIDSTGRALVPARETLAIGDLPDSVFHDVVIRVVAERWTAAGFAEERVLERAVRASESIGQPTILQFWPGNWPSNVVLATADRLKSFRTAALQQRRWSVTLLAGGSTTSATLLDSGTRDHGAGPGLGGLGGGIGRGLQRLDPGTDASSRDVLSAVWLEYEIRAPGAPVRPTRRKVFDLIGPAGRGTNAPPSQLSDTQRLERSLALMMRTEILPLPARFAPEFVGWLTTQSLLANRRLLHATAAGGLDPGTPVSDSLFSSSAPPVGPLSALALARSTLSPVGDEIYVGHAGLLTRHQGPDLAGEGIAMLDAVDIVANDVDVALNVPDGFAARLAQGVFETNAEAVLPVSSGRIENAGSAYAAAPKAWVVLRPEHREEVTRLRLSDDVRDKIRRELDAGYTVVAPREVGARDGPGYAAWWRIDPATGATLGMGDRGWGQMVDRAMLTDLAAYMAENFAFEYGLCQAIPQVVNDLRFVGNVLQERGWAPSWTKAAPQAVDPLALAKANDRVCVIQAIKMGFVATLPLVLLTIRYTTAGRVVWNPALRRFVYNEIGGIRIPPSLVTGPVHGGPSLPHGSPTLPSIHVPEGAGTSPKGYPNPHEPGLQGPNGAPGSSVPSSNPLGKTEPASPESQLGLDKTAPDVASPRTPLDAREELQEAAAAADAAQAENMRATGEWLRYRINKPSPDPNWFPEDPSVKWDPVVDEALHNEAQQMAQQSREAIERLTEAQRAARDAQAAARGAAGKGGFPAPQPAPAPQQAPAPQPNLPGCPPNCGNENLTAPQIQVQPSASAEGRIEVGSAGVASSFYPIPWPK
jgi:hypothetical protein